jgi:hypothetical protein
MSNSMAVGLIPDRHAHYSKSTFEIFQFDLKAIKQTRATSAFIFQIGKT